MSVAEILEESTASQELSPANESFLRETLEGLRKNPKELSCKYLYDQKGSQLFEEICTLEEYYPTRTELGIMDRHVHEMAEFLGPNCLLLEFGAGSGHKTEILLEALQEPAGYVPIDISCEHLEVSARRLGRRFPELEILPVCGDFMEAWSLPVSSHEVERLAVYFPGSTIGNFTAPQAERFLRRVAEICGPGGKLLLGADLKKDPAILELAYDDPSGVTSAFNLNLLEHINRELGADFALDAFAHRAPWVEQESRIEMHLESLRDQVVHVGGERFTFEAGERICTEHSHKYSLEAIEDLARAACMKVDRVWTDPDGLFSVQALTVIGD